MCVYIYIYISLSIYIYIYIYIHIRPGAHPRVRQDPLPRGLHHGGGEVLGDGADGARIGADGVNTKGVTAQIFLFLTELLFGTPVKSIFPRMPGCFLLFPIRENSLLLQRPH